MSENFLYHKKNDRLLFIKKKIISLFKKDQFFSLFNNIEYLNCDMPLYGCYRDNIINEHSTVIRNFLQSETIEELCIKFSAYTQNERQIDFVLNKKFYIDLNILSKIYEEYNQKPTPVLHFFEDYRDKKKIEKFNIPLISPELFEKLKKLSDKYGFYDVKINFDFYKYGEDFCDMLNYSFDKLKRYLNLSDKEAILIGKDLSLILGCYDQKTPPEILGAFRYWNKKDIDQNENIRIYENKLQLNYQKGTTKKNQLFRVLLHEFVHFMDFKLGSKIISNLSIETNMLYSDLEPKYKKIYRNIYDSFAFIINENMNGSELSNDTSLLIKSDSVFLDKILKKHFKNERKIDLFVKNNAHNFYLFLNHINKIQSNEIKFKMKEGRILAEHPYDFFIKHIEKMQGNKKKRDVFLRKHIFVKKLLSTFGKKIDFLLSFLNSLQINKNYSYVKERYSYYDSNYDLIFKKPKIFKKSIFLSGKSAYLSSSSETLTWSLTGGLSHKKRINQEFIQWLFSLIYKNNIEVKNKKFIAKENKQPKIIKGLLEHTNIITISPLLLIKKDLKK